MAFTLGVGSSLAANALQAIAQRALRKKGFAPLLVKRVVNRLEFAVSKRKLIKWAESERGTTLLGSLDEADLPAIAEDVRPIVGRGRRNKRIPTAVLDERANEIAKALTREFLASLSPEYAIAVAHVRNEKRFDSIQQSLHPDPLNELYSLPPGTHTPLRRLHASQPEAAIVLLRLLVDNTRSPDAVVRVLRSESPPAWSLSVTHDAWEAVGSFLAAYDTSAAIHFLERAAEEGSPRATILYLRAALIAADSDGGAPKARELLTLAPSSSRLNEAVAARIDNRARKVLELIQASEDNDPEAALLWIVLLAWSRHALGSTFELRQGLEQAIERFPERAALKLSLASLLASEAGGHPQGSGQATSLLERAALLSLEARDQFRRWSGDTSEAVKIACSAYLTLGRPEVVRQLALPKPEGEADERESRDPKVRAAAAMALLQLDQLQEVESLDLSYLGQFDRCLVEASRLRDSDSAQAQRLLAQAIDLAGSPAESAAALFGLAHFAVERPTELEILRADLPEAADLISALAASRLGEFATAIGLLRPWTGNSTTHAELLADVYCKSGDIDSAIQVLLRTGEALESPTLMAHAVAILIRTEQTGRAETIAQSAIVLFPTQTIATRQLRRQLVELAYRRDDFQAMEAHARALTNVHPSDVEGAWAVVYSLMRRERRRAAWEEIQERRLEPHDEQTAVVTIELTARYLSPFAQAVARVLRVANRFKGSEHVEAAALTASYSKSKGEVLPGTLVADLQNRASIFVEQYPDSRLFQQIESADMDSLVADLIARLAPGAEERQSLVWRVRLGLLPVGMIRLATERSYASILSNFGAGALTAIAESEVVRGSERRVARDALGKSVVVDTTAVVCRMMLADLPSFQERYTLLLPESLLIDAAASKREADFMPAGTLDYDPASGKLVYSETDEQQFRELRARVDELHTRLSMLEGVADGSFPAPPGITHGDFEPWMSSLRVALAMELPLFCDDLALRMLAQYVGVPVFGSYAALEVLAEDGVVSSDVVTRVRRAMLNNQIFDVPASLNELWEWIEEEEFALSPIIRTLMRPALWSKPSETLEWLGRLISRLAVSRHVDSIPDWVYAATIGFALSVEPIRRPKVAGSLLAIAIWRSGFSSGLVPRLVAGARLGGQQAEPGASFDPLPEAVGLLLRVAIGAAGGELGAPYILNLFGGLEEDDRSLVLQVVLGIR